MQIAVSLKTITMATLLGAAFSASVLAQTGAGPGPGPYAQGAGSGSMAPGMRGMRGMRFDAANTPGWTLMTAQERAAHQAKMREVKTYEECKQVQAEHHTLMQARAQEKGVTLRAPRQNGCDVAKARGWIQ